MLISHQSINDFAVFLGAHKKQQNDNDRLTAELQETKAKLKRTEIDRINDYKDQTIVH
jgi:hypothetical protein